MKVHVITFSLGSRKGEIKGKHAGCYTFRNNFRLLCSFRTLGLNDLKIVNELTSSFPSSPKVPSPSEPKQNYRTIYGSPVKTCALLRPQKREVII